MTVAEMFYLAHQIGGNMIFCHNTEEAIKEFNTEDEIYQVFFIDLSLFRYLDENTLEHIVFSQRFGSYLWGSSIY